MSSSPSSSRRRVSACSSNGTARPSKRTSSASRSTSASPAAISAFTSSSGSTTGSSPIFVQLQKKMSANEAATTALKP